MRAAVGAVHACVCEWGGMQGFVGLRGLATEAGKQLEPLFCLHGQNGPEACSWLCGGEVDRQTCKLAGSAGGEGEGRGGEREWGRGERWEVRGGEGVEYGLSMFEVFSPECKGGVSNGEGRARFDHSELKREKEQIR